MKRNRLLSLSTLTVVSFFLLQSWSGGYNGAYVANTPTVNGCSGSGCHNTAATSNQLSIFMKDLNGNIVNTYVPDSTYQVEISLNQIAAHKVNAKGGFQSVITNAIGTAVGTFQGTAMPGQVTQSTASLKNIMMHNTSVCGPIQDLSGIITWTYKWKAPVFGGGNITVHVIANDANGTNTSAGDNIVYGNNPVLQGFAAALNDLEVDLKSVYPNPTRNTLNVNLSSSSKSKVHIYSISGQLLMTQDFNQSLLSMDLSQLNAGNYFMSVEQDNKVAKRTIVKL